MNLPESIALSSFALSVIGFMWKISFDMAEIKKQVTNDIQHIAEEEDKKRVRMYERVDEIKKSTDEKFVQKDMCKVINEDFNKTLIRIEMKLDKIVNGK